MLTYAVIIVIAIPLVLLVVDVASPGRSAKPAPHARPPLSPEAPAHRATAPASSASLGAPVAGRSVTRAVTDEDAGPATPPRPRIAPGDGMVYRGPLRQG